MPYRSHVYTEAAGPTLDSAVPGGLQPGDILVWITCADHANNVASFPPGFREIPGSPIESTYDGQSLHIAIKIADGSEAPGPLTVVHSSGINVQSHLAAYYGQVQEHPSQFGKASGGSGSIASGGTLTAPSQITTPFAQSIVIWAGALDSRLNPVGAVFTLDPNFTKRDDQSATYYALAFGDWQKPNAGNINLTPATVTFLQAASGWLNCCIVLSTTQLLGQICL